MSAPGQVLPSRLRRHRVRYTPESRRFAATPKSSESGQGTKSLRDSGSSGLVLSAVPGEEIVDSGGVLRIELSLTSSNVVRHAWRGTSQRVTSHRNPRVNKSQMKRCDQMREATTILTKRSKQFRLGKWRLSKSPLESVGPMLSSKVITRKLSSVPFCQA